MSLKLRYFAPLLVCAVATALIAAPIAAAESGDLPQPGSEDASATIQDLQSRGYDVQINWVSGLSNASMDQCWVNGINAADARTGGVRTAYVDVECPH
jgi:hypothetical protein